MSQYPRPVTLPRRSRMDDRVHRGCSVSIFLVPLGVPIPFCCHPLDTILGHLVLFLFHLNGVDKSLHDTVQLGDVGFQLLHGEATVWGSWVNVVVGVWPCLWGCLGLGLDIQLCNGVFDCIIVQAAGDRAWPLMV